jgi:hypothetical protein
VIYGDEATLRVREESSCERMLHPAVVRDHDVTVRNDLLEDPHDLDGSSPAEVPGPTEDHLLSPLPAGARQVLIDEALIHGLISVVLEL